MGKIGGIEVIAPRAGDQPTPEVVDVPHNIMFMGSLTHTGAVLSGDFHQPGPSLRISLKEDFSSCTNTPRPERP